MAEELEGSVKTIIHAAIRCITTESTPKNEWRLAIEIMKWNYDHAQKERIKLAIEPINRLETYFLNRSDKASVLAEAVGPDCGVCFDTFHFNIEGSGLYQAIVNMRERLRNFHVCDTNRFTCGMSHYDWARVIDSLKKAGYDGWLKAELTPGHTGQSARAFGRSFRSKPAVTPRSSGRRVRAPVGGQ